MTDQNTGFKLETFALKPEDETAHKRADDLLWGTGLNKESLTKQAREVEKILEQAQKQTAQDETDVVEISSLPTTLVRGDLILYPAQQNAVLHLITQYFGCITGPAGTGKTTALKALLNELLCIQTVFDQATQTYIPFVPHVVFCAFTGKAVQQMKRALPFEYHDHCDTIHGVLEYAPEYVEKFNKETGRFEMSRIFLPRRHSGNLLDQNIIIIDEATMLDISLWHKLLDALRPDTRVYMIGDINQLEPVTGKSVFGFALQQWPSFELDQIKRTNENAIIENAWRILKGQAPQAYNGKVIIKALNDNSLTAYKEIIAVIQRLTGNGSFDPMQDCLIVPQNKGNIGQISLNERLTGLFNPPQKDPHTGLVLNPRMIVTSGFLHHSFAVGDKVMVTQNDRDRLLTNGMTGVIIEIAPNVAYHGVSIGESASANLPDDYDFDLADIAEAAQETPEEEAAEREKQASHVVTIKFQNVEEPMTFGNAGAVNSLMHAYAITCHKAQGSEYRNVVIALHSCNWRMLSREWLYTAWTRAREKVIFLMNGRGLNAALMTQRIKGKTLQEKAQYFIDLQATKDNGGDVRVPLLPKARTVGG